MPFVLYVVVLVRLWFNAPIWDDYGSVLDSARAQLVADSPAQWLHELFRMHNEHWIAVLRLLSWSFVKIAGHIDFRVIMLLGVAAVLVVALLAWREFRDAVPPLVFLGAGLLLFQWSWFEAALTATSFASLTALAFAFACLYLAPRPGLVSAAAAFAFGVLATLSQANGLFAFPLTMAGCLYQGQRRRAAFFAVCTLVTWALYLPNYHRPDAHPAPLFAFQHPVDTLRFFVMIVGSIVPGYRIPLIVGVLMVAVAVWLVYIGLWRRYLVATLWVVFIVGSVAAAAVGRVGLGVVYTSRFAIYSSVVAMILLLGVCAATTPWTRLRIACAVALSALMSASATWLSWPAAVEYSVNGHRLAKTVTASPDMQVQPYFGMFFPFEARSAQILAASETLGIYEPPRVVLYPTRVGARASIPSGARVAGSFDNFAVEGSNLTVGGWADIPATIPGRTITVVSAVERRSAGPVRYDDRRDVAMVRRDPLMEFAGFHVQLEYPSEAEARRAAASMCIVVSAPGHGEAVLPRHGVDCSPARK